MLIWHWAILEYFEYYSHIYHLVYFEYFSRHIKSNKLENPHPLFPDLPNYSPNPVDGINIGDSPLPGITLRRILRSHEKRIGRIVWSPNGKYLASPSADHSVGIWDVAKSKMVKPLIGHKGSVHCIAWEPNGHRLISGSEDKTLKIWKTNGMHQQTLEGHFNTISSVAYSPNGRFLASASYDSTIRIWNKHGKYLDTIRRHSDGVLCIAWSPDAKYLASGSYDTTCRIWDIKGKQVHLLRGHSSSVCSVSWSQDGKYLVTTSSDSTIRIWDPKSGITLQVLEGHIGRVNSAMFSASGNLLVSKGGDKDNSVLLWRCDTWDCLGKIRESSSRFLSPSLAFHPFLSVLATLGEGDKAIRVWELDERKLLDQEQTSIQYTTAKIVLVGDSGVGKTGLGWRLVHDEFKEHASTHGQQFWVMDKLQETLDDGTICEAILWDLAGQQTYRMVHSLFLDEPDVALILFDSGKKLLTGVKYWLNQLKKNRSKCMMFLVASRIDRGMVSLTQEEIRIFCERNKIKGGYYPTSAMTGDGVPRLIQSLRASIPWNNIYKTTTTETFRRIKEYVLELKDSATRNNLLKDPEDLYRELQEREPTFLFSNEEMMTAVGHLKNHGYVNVLTLLTDSGHAQKILLNPEELVNVASAIVLKAESDINGLGILEEKKLLSDGYTFSELRDFDETERKLLLGAASELFIQKNLCFRERVSKETLLVFPSLINKKPLRAEAKDFKEGASYDIKGPVENVYPLLVVRLWYTTLFSQVDQWQNLAQFKIRKGEVCRFMQNTTHEGEIELVLSFAKKTSEQTKVLFQGLVEQFLSGRELKIKRYLPVICPQCDTQMARVVLKEQLDRNKEHSFCHECGEKLNLPSAEAITHLQTDEERMIAAATSNVEDRTKFETALSRMKVLHLELNGKNDKQPTCYICYDRRSNKAQDWVSQFNRDLKNAGIHVTLDPRKRIPKGEKRWDAEKILSCDFVTVIGTPSLKKKSQREEIRNGLETELELINLRVNKPLKYGPTIIPIIIKGEADTAFPSMLSNLPFIDFRNEETYFFFLLKTIWRILDLPFDIPAWDEISGSLEDKNDE